MLGFTQTPDGFGVNAVAAERGVGPGGPVAMNPGDGYSNPRNLPEASKNPVCGVRQ